MIPVLLDLERVQFFSIGAGKLAEFFQPDKDSAVLNRVTGHLGSEIQGRLAADGRVILINPNGIVVGPDGRIDTAGFIGSTLDVADNDFLEGGDLVFAGDSAAGLLENQNVVIETAGGEGGEGDLFINESVSWESAYSLGLLAHRHIRANAGVQAGGDGELVLAAGWDGETGFDPDSGAGRHEGAVDVDALLDNPESYGNHEGSVFIDDGIQTDGVAVGSRFGTTIAMGYGIHLKGGEDDFGRYARLGFRADPDEQPFSVSGPIQVRFHGELRGEAGKLDYDDYGDRLSTVSIGHGLNEPHSRGGVQHEYQGDIEIRGGGNISFEGQIGHGGAGAGGRHTGNISLTDVGEVTLLHLGHGGAAAGNHSGDIEIRNAGSLSFPGDFEAVGHLGHRTQFGDLEGNISVRNVGDLIFVSGDFH